MAEPVAITAIGCIGAPGADCAAQLRALRAGKRCLRQSSLPGLPLSMLMPLGIVDSPLPANHYRNAALAVHAGAEALAAIPRPMRRRLGLIVGTSTGGMGPSEAVYLSAGPDQMSPVYRHQQMHCVTRLCAEDLGIHGPQSTHSVACVSAACALIEAMGWLRSGLVDACLVIGTDANTRLTAAGFHSLQLVDQAGCRPLTEERAGMNLGEGAAALLLERPEHARARSAPILAYVSGWGLRGDGYHPTSPDPSATQLTRAINDALSDAQLSAADIGWINAHGTGTRDNDATEAIAFSQCLPQVPVSSIKAIYGHTMGAAAAIEAVACVLALQHQERYPSVGADNAPAIPGLNLQRQWQPGPLRAVLSTSLAFGGMDAALVFTEAQQCA